MYAAGAAMIVIANHFNVPIDAIVYAMRKGNIPRRSMKEVQRLRFLQKKPSFEPKILTNDSGRTIETTGIALYWAEGYKTSRASGVDFANSDPSMIAMFMKFLRTCYNLDSTRFRISLYCYSDQDIPKIMNYWSKLTGIPKSQFQKPYVRQDFRTDGRKMPYGLIHIRYADKKLLYDILGRIDRLKTTIWRVGTQVVNEGRL